MNLLKIVPRGSLPHTEGWNQCAGLIFRGYGFNCKETSEEIGENYNTV